MSRLTDADLRAVQRLAMSGAYVLQQVMREALLELVAYYRAGTHNLNRRDTDDAQPVEKCPKSV